MSAMWKIVRPALDVGVIGVFVYSAYIFGRATFGIDAEPHYFSGLWLWAFLGCARGVMDRAENLFPATTGKDEGK